MRSPDDRAHLLQNQAEFMKQVAAENDMTYSQLVQYVTDDFLLALVHKGYRFQNPDYTTRLRQYIRSKDFKRKRRERQNG